MLALENRIARLEEQVARLSAALSAASPSAEPSAAVRPAAAPVGDYVEARALAADGRKIEAIKVVREQSAMSLRAAKDLVESW
jgi:large subunit ribosomal protein L7/L12